MKDYQEINDHVFEGGQLPPGVDPAEVARAAAIRDTLKATRIPECQLGIEHLRNGVLDRSSRKSASRLPWGWLGSGIGVAVAAGILAVLQPRTPSDLPAPGQNKPTSIVAMQDEAPSVVAEVAPAVKAGDPAAAEPVSEQDNAAPPPERNRKPRRVRRAPVQEPAVDVALVAKAEPRRETSADAAAGEATAAAPAVAKPADPVVVVVQPSPGHGRAVEVGLGQDVLFGG